MFFVGRTQKSVYFLAQSDLDERLKIARFGCCDCELSERQYSRSLAGATDKPTVRRLNIQERQDRTGPLVDCPGTAVNQSVSRLMSFALLSIHCLAAAEPVTEQVDAAVSLFVDDTLLFM